MYKLLEKKSEFCLPLSDSVSELTQIDKKITDELQFFMCVIVCLSLNALPEVIEMKPTKTCLTNKNKKIYT